MDTTSTPDLDATMFTFTGHAPDSIEEIIDSKEYADRWAARGPYERWKDPVPACLFTDGPEEEAGDIAAILGVRIGDGDVLPERASELGYDVEDAQVLTADDRVLGYPMYTAINRLYACLAADGHEDTPAYPAKVTDPAGQTWGPVFATADDVRRFFHIVRAAATQVLGARWRDWQHRDDEHLSAITPFDRTLPHAAARYLDKSDDWLNDNGFVTHPAIAALWSQLEDYHRYLRRLTVVLDRERTSAQDPANPDAPVPYADIVAATELTGDVDDLAGHGKCVAFWDQTPAQVWKSVTTSSMYAALRTRALDGAYQRVDATALLSGPLAAITSEIPGLTQALNAAWFAHLIPAAGPHPAWPAISPVTSIATNAAGEESIGYTYQIASPDHGRRLLALLADVVAGLYARELRTAAPGRINPALHTIYRRYLRTLADVDTLNDDQVAAVTSGRPKGLWDTPQPTITRGGVPVAAGVTIHG